MKISKIAILFTDYHIDYSPSTLQLFLGLERLFDVKLLAFRYRGQPPLPFSCVTIGDGAGWAILISTIDRCYHHLSSLRKVPFERRQDIGRWVRSWLAWIRLYFNRPDLLIAVDYRAVLIGQSLRLRTHLLSLEVPRKNDPFYQKVDPRVIEKVLIQSKERFEYLFPQTTKKWFLIPNSAEIDETACANKRRSGIVFCGAPQPLFGIDFVAEFAQKYPQEQVTLKGPFVREVAERYLRKNIRFVIDDSYTEIGDLPQSLQYFEIGLCFYLLSLVDENYSNRYNYESAPSGKLFSYFSAGIPVIGTNIPGLSIVTDYQAGVLIDQHDPESIAGAVQRIRSNYASFQNGAIRASRNYSFSKYLNLYINDLGGGCSCS